MLQDFVNTQDGVPSRNRTHGLLRRTQLLYPTELRKHIILNVDIVAQLGNIWSTIPLSLKDREIPTPSRYWDFSFQYGAPERIRTSDTRFRKPPLYPAELQVQGSIIIIFTNFTFVKTIKAFNKNAKDLLLPVPLFSASPIYLFLYYISILKGKRILYRLTFLREIDIFYPV